MTESERFVYEVCRKSFLSLWSYANPLRENGEELCDILIVCEPDIIIFSVKEISLTHSGDAEVDWKRWYRRAVEKSANQIYGAEKWVRKTAHVIKSDGSAGISIAESATWRIHRIAVAFGSGGDVPFPYDDFGKGIVHIFDESSLRLLLSELDTISDFVDYLTSKASFLQSETTILFEGTEKDLLAHYLSNSRTILNDGDAVLIPAGLWETFIKTTPFRAKKEADRESYLWDKLIEILCMELPKSHLESGPSFREVDLVVRAMARENRFARRLLARHTAEFMRTAKSNRIGARLIWGTAGVGYVFVAPAKDETRDSRMKELSLRCFVARSLLSDCATIVGIAYDGAIPGHGFSTTLCYFHQKEWTKESQAGAEHIQRELGYFASPQRRNVHEMEYPDP